MVACAVLALGVLAASRCALAAEVTLAWDPSSSDDVGGYKVHYGRSSGNYTSTRDVGNSSSVTLTGLQEGRRYYFAVSTYDVDRRKQSTLSAEVSALIPVTQAAGPPPAESLAVVPMVIVPFLLED